MTQKEVVNTERFIDICSMLRDNTDLEVTVELSLECCRILNDIEPPSDEISNAIMHGLVILQAAGVIDVKDLGRGLATMFQVAQVIYTKGRIDERRQNG